MDHATLVTTAAFLCGSTAGALTLGFFAGLKHDRLRREINAKDEAISGFIAASSDRYQELTHLGTRCSELRIENRDKDQANEKLTRRIAELEPDAAEGKRAREQRAANLAKMQQANRDRAAAKRAGNVSALPKRKRA